MDSRNIQDEYMRVAEEVRRLHWMHMRKDDIFGREFAFLKIIWGFQRNHPDVPGIYVSDLAACMGVTKSAASKMLRNLEQQGLIERAVDKHNRRNTFVFLSPDGRVFCEEQHARWCMLFRRVTEQLGEEHFREILNGIHEMMQVMACEIQNMSCDSVPGSFSENREWDLRRGPNGACEMRCMRHCTGPGTGPIHENSERTLRNDTDEKSEAEEGTQCDRF